MTGLGTAVLYAFTTTALYYLGAWARITEAFWSRYPARLARFMECAACVGTWWGLVLGLLGAWQGWAFLELPGRSPWAVVSVALCTMVTTPILGRGMITALLELQPEDDD